MIHQNVEIDERTVQGIGISFVLNKSDRWITTSNDRQNEMYRISIVSIILLS